LLAFLAAFTYEWARSQKSAFGKLLQDSGPMTGQPDNNRQHTN